MIKLAAQSSAQGLDSHRVEVRKIGQGAFTNLLTFAKGFTKQHGGWRIAIGNDVDIHEHRILHNPFDVNKTIT
jgi:hypothetical protein